MSIIKVSYSSYPHIWKCVAHIPIIFPCDIPILFPCNIPSCSHVPIVFPFGSVSKPCTPGEHQNSWQMDVHPLINCIYRYWSIPISMSRISLSLLRHLLGSLWRHPLWHLPPLRGRQRRAARRSGAVGRHIGAAKTLTLGTGAPVLLRDRFDGDFMGIYRDIMRTIMFCLFFFGGFLGFYGDLIGWYESNQRFHSDFILKKFEKPAKPWLNHVKPGTQGKKTWMDFV